MGPIRARVCTTARTVLAVTVGLGLTVTFGGPAAGRTDGGGLCRPPTGYATTLVGEVAGANASVDDVNNAGWVVGDTDTEAGTHTAFVWRRGRTRAVTPPGAEGQAVEVNDRGEVLHTWFDAVVGEFHAGLWRSGRTIDLGTVASLTPLDLNERGEVLLPGGLWRRGTITPIEPPPGSGFSLDPRHLGAGGHVIGLQGQGGLPGGPHPTGPLGFIWRDGVLADVTAPGGVVVDVVDVDRSGRVLGLGGPRGRAFLWDDGTATDLGSLGGPDEATQGNDLNDEGQVVGWSAPEPGQQHAILWQDGVLTDLHPVPGDHSEAIAVNARGEALGTVLTAAGTRRVVVWSCGREVPVTIPGVDDGSLTPVDINDRGQVLTSSVTGTTSRGFLSTPIRR